MWEYLEEYLRNYDLTQVDVSFRQLFPEFRLDLEELFLLILKGNVTEAVKQIIGQVQAGLSGELAGIRNVFLYLLVLGILSAFFAGFSDLFSGGQISQAGFYFLYLVLIALLSRVFMQVSAITTQTIENIVLFVKLSVPTYFVAMGAAGQPSGAVFYYQFTLVAVYLAESFLLAVLVPFVYSYVLLSLLNGLWAEEKLGLLLDFMKKGIGFALKISMGAVTGLSLVQAVIMPVIDRLQIAALQKVVTAIPGIGSVAESVTELVLGCAVLVKNSMGVLLLILLLGACLIPVGKILLIAGTVKLGAAIAGIVSDKRISGCMDRVGEGCLLMLRCSFTALLLFLVVLAVTTCSIGGIR